MGLTSSPIVAENVRAWRIFATKAGNYRGRPHVLAKDELNSPPSTRIARGGEGSGVGGWHGRSPKQRFLPIDPHPRARERALLASDPAASRVEGRRSTSSSALSRASPDDAEPVIRRAFARPVGIALRTMRPSPVDLHGRSDTQVQSRRLPRETTAPSGHIGLVISSQKQKRTATSATLKSSRGFIFKPLPLALPSRQWRRIAAIVNGRPAPNRSDRRR